MGTPHRGSSAAKYGEMLGRIASIGAAASKINFKDLKSKSDRLLRLGHDFEPLTRSKRIQTLSFYETLKTKMNVIKNVMVSP